MAGYYPDGKGKPGRKPKFRPRITRIKLNPEQVVLWCDCYYTNKKYVSGSGGNYIRVYFPPLPGTVRVCEGTQWWKSSDTFAPYSTGTIQIQFGENTSS